jgi:hypothetical protein
VFGSARGRLRNIREVKEMRFKQDLAMSDDSDEYKSLPDVTAEALE